MQKKHSCIDALAELTEWQPHFATFINTFRQGIFSSDLKRAKVIPIHKSGSKFDENNYRPISLLMVFSKIFERVMCDRLYYYFEKFNLFYSKQFGFANSKKHSCIDALAELTEWQRHQKNNAATYFFLDLKKAFDTLDHETLLKKLLRNGIRGNAFKGFRGYLSNRVKKVELQGYTSGWREASRGAEQGSVLGPLLFLIYIYDLPLCCDSVDVFLFADDTNL